MDIDMSVFAELTEEQLSINKHQLLTNHLQILNLTGINHQLLAIQCDKVKFTKSKLFGFSLEEIKYKILTDTITELTKAIAYLNKENDRYSVIIIKPEQSCQN